jgi:signal transduction histidine kinase
MMELTSSNRRILIVDDNPSIHDDFRRILSASAEAKNGDDLDAEASRLFGEAAPIPNAPKNFEIDSALQGEDALELVVAARAAGRPYALAFVDMRMPPGWDGLTTINKIWEVDPELQVVICTAYSDHGWSEIQAALASRERWLVLKKPFDKIEALQLADSLSEKWNLSKIANTKIGLLEEMVGVRTEQLQRSIRVKHEFLANVTHELLTPMNGIMGMLDLMADETPGPVREGHLFDARTCAVDLLRLLKQVVAFNEAEAGTLALDVTAFNPSTLIAEVIEAYGPRAAHKGLKLETEIASDCDRLHHAPLAAIRHILWALVDNAVKFTHQGSIAVRLRHEDEFLLFVVEDTGIGVSDEQLSWMALPFTQVDGNASRGTGGIGLGLPMARRLTSSLGGTLSIERREVSGISVKFTILPSKATSAQ